MMKRTGWLGLVLALAACGEGGADAQAAPEMTQEQRDSAIAEMPIPGAGAVGTALEARERLDARAEAHDTIR